MFQNTLDEDPDEEGRVSVAVVHSCAPSLDISIDTHAEQVSARAATSPDKAAREFVALGVGMAD